MNRKFFNLLLMGALAVTAIGSVSSCKDYDDDINNLQKQIDQAALKTEVTALQTTLANVQSAATAAQAAADNALTKAVGGQTAAGGAQTTADEALAKAEEALATALAALPSTDATAIREALATINATAEENATNVAKAIQDAADAAAAAAAANTAAGNAQTSADAANAAAEEAKTEAATKAQEAKDYADEKIAEKLAELESTLSAVQNNEQVIAAIKSIAQAEIETAIPADLSEKLDALTELINNAGTKEEIKELLASVRSFQGGIDALYTAVTSVEIIGSYTAEDASRDVFYSTDPTVKITCGKVDLDDDEEAFTFGEADEVAEGHVYSAYTTVSYVNGTPFSYADGELLVRVNPTNVNLNTATIKFIDSKGNALDDVIEVAKVEKFDVQLTRGTTYETGLWKLTLKSKKNLDDTKKAVTTGDAPKSILYAVGVNNTDAAADRYVVSTYDVAFQANDYTAPTSLDNVTVKAASKTDGKKLSEIKPAETKPAYAVNNGEEFQVSFADAKDYEYFYVVCDSTYADDDDEFRAWASYKYAGDFRKMIAVNHGANKATLKVTIPEQYKTGDEVQFRVFAVSYDGTKVLNKAFRVFVGADKSVATVTGDLKFTGYKKMETELLPISGTLKEGANLTASTVTIKNEGAAEDASINVAYYDKDKTALTSNVDPTKVKYVKFSYDGDAFANLADGAVATGVIEGKDAANDDVVANTINVSLKKVMPTAADVDAIYEKYGMTWKDKQLVNGVYTAYLYPDYMNGVEHEYNNWTKLATQGYKDLAQAINNLPVTDGHVYLTVENATLKLNSTTSKSYYTDPATFKPAEEKWLLTASVARDSDKKPLIDNTTKHAAAFGYDFGEISSDEENHAHDYLVSASDDLYKFQIVFANPLDESVQTYEFEKKNIGTAAAPNYVVVNVLTYNDPIPAYLTYTDADAVADATTPNGTFRANCISNYIVAKNSYDNATFGGWFFKYGQAEKSLRWMKYIENIIDEDGTTTYGAKAKLISNGNGKEDYFKVSMNMYGHISFKPVSGATVPQQDVPSTLVIDMLDCFGQVHEYKLPFTVKKPE